VNSLGLIHSDQHDKNEQKKERLLTAGEVAEWLRVQHSWIHAHATGRRRPHLPSIKLGGSLRFRESDIQKFIEECSKWGRC